MKRKSKQRNPTKTKTNKPTTVYKEKMIRTDKNKGLHYNFLGDHNETYSLEYLEQNLNPRYIDLCNEYILNG